MSARAEGAARLAQHWRETAQKVRSGRQAAGFGEQLRRDDEERQ